MNVQMEKLSLMGCDLEGAMERFLDDEEFYMECYEGAMQDNQVQQLGEALHRENVRESFEIAHRLKGIVANLGLTPLNEIMLKIVEPLRNGSMEGVLSEYQVLQNEWKKYEHIMTL